MRKGYGQFCPVAKAAEVLGDRWNLLVLREMLYGNRYFNDISRGVPLMSRALLALCQKNPGFEVDVLISADLSAFTHVWMGYADLHLALKQGTICFEGDRALVRQVSTWLYLNGEWRYGMGLDRSAAQLMQANQPVATEGQGREDSFFRSKTV
jgi:HxlR-like helix-turn-helix